MRAQCVLFHAEKIHAEGAITCSHVCVRIVVVFVKRMP